MFENTKRLLDLAEKMGIPAMQVRVYHKGVEVFSEHRGVFSENGEKLSGNELYNIYSCSKFITCTAALKLLEEGKFSLDDDVADYISAFADMAVKYNGGIYKAEKRIKVRNLFTMTSGLNYNMESDEIAEGIKQTEGKCPTLEMMKYVAKMPLDFEPGERWQYSLSHDVIGALIEVVSGMSFGEYVKKTIFDPLGMTDATYILPQEKLGSVCEQYKYFADEEKYKNVGKGIFRYQPGPMYESGGAGITCTVKDYMLFLEAMRLGKILKEETLLEMTRPQLTDAQRETFWGPGGYNYGLGVRVPMGDGRRTDYGWGGAAGAFAAVDAKNDITLYYSQHVLTSPFAKIRKDYIEAVKLDLGYDAFTEDMWNGMGNTLA